MSRQVLIFGTSNTLGCFDEKGGWADRLKQYCIRKHLEAPDYFCLIYNLGVSGDTSEDLGILNSPPAVRPGVDGVPLSSGQTGRLKVWSYAARPTPSTAASTT